MLPVTDSCSDSCSECGSSEVASPWLAMRSVTACAERHAVNIRDTVKATRCGLVSIVLAPLKDSDGRRRSHR